MQERSTARTSTATANGFSDQLNARAITQVGCAEPEPLPIGRVLFVITGLDCGGAEMMLFKVLSHLDRKRVFPFVVSLRGAGFTDSLLKDLEFPVHHLNWTRLAQSPGAIRTLMSTVRQIAPDLIQGWMLHGNLATHLMSFASRNRVPIIWNMRHSLHDLKNEKIATKVVIRWLRHWSHISARIIYNSRAVARQHEEIGFDPARTVVIPNGFDCEHLRPKPDRRSILRSELRIPAEIPLIGLVARVHRTKDHRTFLEAAKILASTGSNAHFVLVGRGTDESEIASQINFLSLQGRVYAFGERPDVAEILPALDIATSSSRAEAFPNVIGEAMACGVPCVVTDVGDCAWLVADTGKTVPRQDPLALSAAWTELLGLGRDALQRLGQTARSRIMEHFSIEGVTLQYERLYRDVIRERQYRRFDDSGVFG